MHCLYQITNLVNGKYYIGVHQDAANSAYMGSGHLIKRAIRKHGKENFRRDVLAQHEDAQFMYQLEGAVVDQAFIDRGDTYNVKTGGIGGRGNKWSLESRERQRLALKGNTNSLGNKQSAETCAKKSASTKGKPRKPFSLETRQRMSASARVKVFSPEHRLNLSKAGMARWAIEKGHAHVV